MPCPWAACEHSLLVDLKRPGVARDLLGDGELDGRDTCALVVAKRGGVSLATVGDALGVTMERAGQIEQEALAKVAAALGLTSVAFKPKSWRGWQTEEPFISGADLEQGLARAEKNPPRLSKPARQLTAEEIAAAFPGCTISKRHRANG